MSTTRDLVHNALNASPATAGTIAERAGVSEDTARTHLQTLRDADDAVETSLASRRSRSGRVSLWSAATERAPRPRASTPRRYADDASQDA